MRVLGPRVWGAMWQQTPRTAGAGLFSRQTVRLISASQVPEGLIPCRYYDWAYTEASINKADPDRTAGALMAFLFDEHYTTFSIYLLDMVATRSTWHDVKKLVRETALRDGPQVYIGGESNGPQKIAIDDLMHDPTLSAYTIWGLPTQKDKVSKAAPWMDRAREGSLMYVVRGEWNEIFFDECEAFPNGVHDDYVDAVSGAYMMCAQRASYWDVAVRQERILSRW